MWNCKFIIFILLAGLLAAQACEVIRTFVIKGEVIVSGLLKLNILIGNKHLYICADRIEVVPARNQMCFSHYIYRPKKIKLNLKRFF